LLSAVTAAKSKILSLAVRGRLVPQDPNDEPASVLLERIRKEREKLVRQGKIKRRKTENAIVRGGDNSYYTWLPESWEVCRLDDIIDYEQPTAYIVKSTRYNDSYQTPVLTAGKSFIIGYTNEIEGICDNLPVIIFDDFTTDIRYVDFKFKVKSSAMKILRNNIADLKFLFYFMRTIEHTHITHKRYWISAYSKKLVTLPPFAEQRRIVIAIETAFEQFDSIATMLA
jgi:type I restriction enzyme S subunit